MIRLLVAAAFFALPTAAFAQEALYKSYMEAANKALKTGEWKEVEKMAKLADKEAVGFKSDDIRRAYPSDTLAGMYRAQSRYSDAIEVLKKSIESAEATAPSSLPVAILTEALGKLYLSLGRADLAEPLMRRALKVVEGLPVSENWRIGYNLNYVADCLAMAGKSDEAELLYKQSLKLVETLKRHGMVGQNLILIAQLYVTTDRFKEADALSKQGLDKINEVKWAGINYARVMFIRATVLVAANKPSEAKDLYKSGLAIFAADLSQTDSPELIPVLTAYAKLLRADKKIAEATKLETRAADLQLKLDKGREALPK